MRNCDGCTLCCHIMAVGDINKEQLTDCQFQSGNGCAIYEKAGYPKSCKLFQCLWTIGKLPWEEKPSETGLVIIPARRGELTKGLWKKFRRGYLQIMARDPRFYLEEKNTIRIDELLKSNVIVLFERNNRRMIGDSNAVAWVTEIVQNRRTK